MQRELVFAVEVEIDAVLLHYKDLTLSLSKLYSSSTERASKGFIFHSIAMDVLFYLKVYFSKHALILQLLFKYGNWFYNGSNWCIKSRFSFDGE
jgi:hypothetical protein